MDDVPLPGPRRGVPAEDFAGWPQALLDETGWAIHCGNPGCTRLLADAAWIDVQMAMIMNSNDEFSAQDAVAALPPAYRRQFRMNVQFSPDWGKDDHDVWSVNALPGTARSRAKTSEGFTQRYIRGILRKAELTLEAQPPAKVICPACETLQVIPRRYRKGVPPAVSQPLP